MKQNVHTPKRLLTILITCCSLLLSSTNSFALLNKGDIVIVGLNSDNLVTNRNVISILATAPIASGETIIIVDYAWDGSISAFVTTNTTAEGFITWTTTAPIAAGTVFTITQTNTTISGLPGTVSAMGWTGDAIASGGDNIFIIQGSIATPTFIWGFANSSAASMATSWLTSGAPSATTSWLPSTLTNGVNAMLLTGVNHADNNVYVGPKVGLRSFVISEIINPANWNKNEDVEQDLAIGGMNFPMNPAFTLPLNNIQFAANYMDSKVQLSWVSNGSPQTQYYVLERSVNGTQFTTINTFTANGFQTNYTFADEIKSIQYYRVKIVNYNGSYVYSTVLSVKPNTLSDISFYPNPAKDYMVIQLPNVQEFTQIKIINAKGVVVKQLSTKNTVNTISISEMASGTYTVILEQANALVAKQFIKQ
jgi:hypothetical protein